MPTYSYASTLFGKTRRYALNGLELVNESERSSIALDQVTHARFVSGWAGGFQVDRLELHSGKQKFILPVVSTAKQPQAKQNYQDWLHLLLEVLGQMQTYNTDLQIRICGTGFWSKCSLILGAFMAAVTVSLFGLAFTTGILLAQGIAISLGLMALALVGALVCHVLNPKTKQIVLTPEQLKTVLIA